MFFSKLYLYFIGLHVILAHPQFNLYYTDWIEKNENVFFHDCLRAMMHDSEESESLFYCLGEFPSDFHFIVDKAVQNFTFSQLRKLNITSQQLYYWSASIDMTEDYQIYLDYNDASLENKTFFNCTSSSFGSQCQYQIPSSQSYYSTLYKLTQLIYESLGSFTRTLTCYTQLQCDRDTESLCLAWSDICNGVINCLNNGVDEKGCWQLEVNQCHEDEHRCQIGQCIPKLFVEFATGTSDCIDVPAYSCGASYEPGFKCADKMSTDGGSALTGSYVTNRGSLLLAAMHSSNKSLYSEQCWSAFKCLIDSSYSKLCQQNSYINIIATTCPDMIFYPNIPVLFGNIYLAYNKSQSQYWEIISSSFTYVCYNTTDYDHFFSNFTKIYFNNLTCLVSSQIPTVLRQGQKRQLLHSNIISRLYENLKNYHLIYDYTVEICNRSLMYQCRNSSKCIFIYRLMNRVNDCPYMDDENMDFIKTTNAMNLLKKTHFKCRYSDKYISQLLVENGRCDCNETGNEHGCNDEYLDPISNQNIIVFQDICDGYTDLLPILINNKNETDETECEYWPCSNIYTQNNGVSNCPTIEDEILYYSNNLLCLSSVTAQLLYLPSEKVNNSQIDCLGAIDEYVCKREVPLSIFADMNHTFRFFYCMNQTSHLCLSDNELCNGHNDCENGDDERFCTTDIRYNLTSQVGPIIRLFSYGAIRKSPGQNTFKLHSNDEKYAVIRINENTMVSRRLDSQVISISDKFRCHFGIQISFTSNPKNQSQTSTCFCPPNYYGHLCQYQNQRISLALQFQALSNSVGTVFTIVVLLIDNTTERIIHSFEQFNFLSLTNCKTKFNIYLLYSTRPKHFYNEYAIHIDIYETDSFEYRGSLLYPIEFPFLPVHRLAYLVEIPSNDIHEQTCFNYRCIHGRYTKYWKNSRHYTFCRCNQGWSGKYCQISHHCQCSPDSICIDKSSNNRSICMCSKNKFGSRCYLTDSQCNSNANSTCLNGGQCLISNQKVACLCPNEFSGDRCEKSVNQLNISFEANIIQSQQYIFIHFHEIPYKLSLNPKIMRSNTFRTLSMDTKSVLIRRSQSFDLVFLELFPKKTYYLIFVNYNSSTPLAININKTMTSLDRCPNITELFNRTFIQWHIIRQIKYYHLLCRNQNLSCFHDQIHLCLCYDFHGKRLANCLQFDHYLTYNCSGRSECENDGQCFQDDRRCPTKSICLCKPCSYGNRCQHRTSGLGLSLDAILSYHIIIKISLILTIIFMLAGLINGALSFMTFKNKSVCTVGCGLYLLSSSITTVILTVLFTLKFIIFILTQMTILTDILFIRIQCYSLEFLIRVCLYLDQWFNACVATERAITIIQSTRFSKSKSRTTAKWMISFLIVVMIVTSIHDPIFRFVTIDDNENEDEHRIKRIWCIVRYGSKLQNYNSIIHTVHFLGPFLLNLISSIVLIIKRAHQQQDLHPDQPYRTIIRRQYQEHKQILIAPIILILLALPRLVLVYLRTCMQSENDAWLYLCGYFVSFIPPMLTFVIFILPSKVYKKELRKTVHGYRDAVRRRLNLN